MGLIALMPIVALALAWGVGEMPLGTMAALPQDHGFELVGTGQSLVVALFVIAGVRLARGPRRR